MHTYSATLKGPLKISGFIDPDDITKITVYWSSPMFSANTVYRSGDVCRPEYDNGYYYQCITNGKSGIQEPIWNQEETTSGTAVFQATPWDLWLLPSESQVIANSIWIASNNEITLSDPVVAPELTCITVSTVPASLLEFELTNQVTKNNGEKLSRTFLYKTNQQ